MRKLIVVAMMSLDGYYTGPDGDMSEMGVDDGFNAYNAERVKTAGTVLMGHTSFKDFSQYWPGRENAKDASKNELEFNKPYYEIEKIVVSENFDNAETPREWKGTVRSISGNIKSEIEKLKLSDGEDIVIWGSRTLWTDLLKNGLVDEIHLVLGTGILGEGVPMFEKDVKPDLGLISSSQLLNSDNVALCYKVLKS